jgi:hypothetical protein
MHCVYRCVRQFYFYRYEVRVRQSNLKLCRPTGNDRPDTLANDNTVTMGSESRVGGTHGQT